MGSVAPWHVGSSQTRARTRVPCIGRQILNHCATREAQADRFLIGPGTITALWGDSWGVSAHKGAPEVDITKPRVIILYNVIFNSCHLLNIYNGLRFFPCIGSFHSQKNLAK